MATLSSKTFRYPGSYGLNTQEETLVEGDQETRFGAVVTNGIVDSTGKLTSREDFALQTSGFSNAIETLFVWKQTDATEVIVSASSGKIYSGTTALTQRIDYSSSSATLNSWQIAVLGSNAMFAQAGVAPRLYDEGWNNIGFSNATFTSPNVVISAFGRMWAADDAEGDNRYTIWWSNLLDAHNWGSGDAGSINLRNSWPDGQDSVIALAPLGNKLVVFGRKSILMYTMPASHDPASLTLAPDDVIYDLGCVSRDSVQVTDQGIFFLSDTGIFKIDRLLQTTQLFTSQHVSLLYSDDVIDQIAAQSNATLIRSVYYPKEGIYLLTFPTPNVSFCVHTRKKVPNVEGALVTTRWTNTGFPWQAHAVNSAGNWYAGGQNGVLLYSGYTPDGASNAYNFVWTTQWLPFEDETRLKHPKKMTLALNAASGQTGSVSWFVDYISGDSRSESFTCDSTEFAEDPGLGYVRVPLGGSFKVLKTQLTFPINGDKVTLQQAQVFATPGAMKP